jgi:hypothetical protein
VTGIWKRFPLRCSWWMSCGPASLYILDSYVYICEVLQQHLYLCVHVYI